MNGGGGALTPHWHCVPSVLSWKERLRPVVEQHEALVRYLVGRAETRPGPQRALCLKKGPPPKGFPLSTRTFLVCGSSLPSCRR